MDETKEEIITEETVAEKTPDIKIEDKLEDETETPKIEDVIDENSDEQLSRKQIKQLDEMLSMLADQINTLGSIWADTQRTYKLKDSHLKALLAFNSQNAEKRPDDLPSDKKEEWDYMNGLTKLTESDVAEIFPDKDAPIYGGTFDITKDRIHEAMQEFFVWSQYKREYEHTQNAYSMLLERDEEAQIAIAKATALAEPDEKIKAMKLAEIEKYYEMKWLKFLREPVREDMFKSIIRSLSDSAKIKYIYQRSKDKLKSNGIDPKFLMMLPKFENQYLDEKYWGNQGVLMVYLMTFLTYNVFDPQHRENIDRMKCFVIAIDRFIRNAIHNEEEKNEITASINMLEDQFLGKVPVASIPHDIAPPTEDLPELNQDVTN